MPDSGRASLQFGTAKGLHIINTGRFLQASLRPPAWVTNSCLPPACVVAWLAAILSF